MLSRALEKRVLALRRRKIRDSEGRFLAEGIRVVEDLLDSPIALEAALVSSSLEDTERGRALAARLTGAVQVERVEDAELARLASTESPQGVLVVAATPRPELEGLVPGEAATVLVLDAIQDPGNLGTLVRTADALGVELVAALPGTVDPWNPKSVRASAGGCFRTPIVATDPEVLLRWLRVHGFAVYAADAGGRPVESVERAARVALVVGNEGGGLGQPMMEAADSVVAVPIEGGAESLNVGVAAGILLYLLTRRG